MARGNNGNFVQLIATCGATCVAHQGVTGKTHRKHKDAKPRCFWSRA